ncbi:LacI family DNA-binding transcriptional regulator [Kribbella sp. NPDC050124]|uniref:LacI family DNA-binding transcriptional regulator n=1 Tax=Kribbella sp. NPDC050124 TaxID=3364114 RepID=UPI003796EB86
MATIVDVARLAGVSTSTVSHVVNATRPVSAATRRKVMAAIEKTGYQQDSVARALRRARTDSIGLVVSDVAQPVFAEMVRGVAHEATAAGLTLLLANSNEDAEVERRSLQVLTARKVDGLIVAPTGGSDRSALDALAAGGTPVVVMDRLGRAGTDQVGVENAGPMHDLVAHLVGHGHRRIALAAGDLTVATIAERRQGYLAALEEARIGVDERYILTGSGLSEDTRTLARALFEERTPPTAFVAASTESAVGVLEAAQDRGLEPPRDFAFATFDGFPHADLFRPRITSVTQPAFDIGATTMQLLLDRLSGRGTAHPKTIRLPAQITYRESCGCPTS